jgi:polar amino acid transport system substrate-binding protein
MHPAKSFLLTCLISAPLLAADLAPTGTLRAAFLRTNPVQGRIDAKTGAITGPVVDLVQALAGELKVPYDIIPAADARDIIARLKAHTADIGFLAYDGERAQEVEFSEPYALMLNTYLVRADSPLKKSADADRSGLRIGVAGGVSQAVVLKELLKKSELKVMPAPPPEEIDRMLMSGDLDAYGANRQRLVEVAAQYPKLRVLPDNFSVAEQSLVVTKGDSSRLDALNQFIQKARSSGLVKSSLERAKLTAGMEVASGRTR